MFADQIYSARRPDNPPGLPAETLHKVLLNVMFFECHGNNWGIKGLKLVNWHDG